MRYVIRIGLAVILVGAITLLLFLVATGLLKVGAGISFLSDLLPVGHPNVIYLKPASGEKYQQMIEKKTFVFLRSQRDIRVEFTSPALSQYWRGGDTYELFRRDWKLDKRPDVVYVTVPGILTFYDYQRSDSVGPVEVGIYRQDKGPWRFAFGKVWEGMVVREDEWKRQYRAWAGTDALHAMVPAEFEQTGISVQAGDYLFLSGNLKPGPYVRVGLRTTNGETYYWPTGRRVRRLDNVRVKGSQEICATADVEVVGRGYYVPYGGELLMACFEKMNYSPWYDVRIGTRSARIAVLVCRR